MGADKGKDDRDWIVCLETITHIWTDTEDSLMTCGSVTPVSLCFSNVKIDSPL